MHPFDVAIALETDESGRSWSMTSPAYANMVGPFGGVTSGLLLNAVLNHPARQGLPVALTVNFAAPIADGAVDVVPRLVRSNRSTQHWLVEACQDGTVALATAVFAERRTTWSQPEASAPRDVPAPHALQRMDAAGLPAWIQRYDMRFVHGDISGGFDGLERADSYSCLWVRDDPPRSMDFPSLAAVCDSFFPRVFLRRRRPMAVGTVSLTTYFHADTAMLAAQADNYALGVARALTFRNGFFDQSAQLWSSTGELMASAYQVVYFRE